jgi:NAD(P)-dependent dehydrogenase (short-subunit alcohol dehydrogenase family)
MNAQNKLLCLAATGLGAWLGMRAYRSLTGFNFQDKSVVVTGGTRGLGLVLSRQLAEQGARLTICARDPEEVNRAREELTQLGVHVQGFVCDISDQEQAQNLIMHAQDRFGRVDVLINNAGVISVGPIATMTRDDFAEAMAINYWGALHTILAALPDMRRRHEGRIVNITSIGGKVSVPHLVPYNASKFALVGLSEGLRAELAQEGIVVTTIVPGLMRTGSPRNAFFKGQNEAEYAWFAISDSLPIASISAESAARQILAACRRGDAEATLGLPAQVMVALQGLFPGLISDMLGLVNRLLPGPGGIGTEKARGFQSESAAAPSILTLPSDRAAQRNNEMVTG